MIKTYKEFIDESYRNRTHDESNEIDNHINTVC